MLKYSRSLTSLIGFRCVRCVMWPNRSSENVVQPHVCMQREPGSPNTRRAMGEWCPDTETKATRHVHQGQPCMAHYKSVCIFPGVPAYSTSVHVYSAGSLMLIMALHEWGWNDDGESSRRESEWVRCSKSSKLSLCTWEDMIMNAWELNKPVYKNRLTKRLQLRWNPISIWQS